MSSALAQGLQPDSPPFDRAPRISQPAPVDIPAYPHESNPNTWPQPDYFDAALSFTHLRRNAVVDDLQLSPSGKIDVVVFPVQTQAFGFAPGLKALVGALIDEALDARQISANHQTDFLSTRSLLIRRNSDAALSSIRASNPTAGFLTAYVGHDGAGTMFLTMAYERGDRKSQVQTTIALDEDVDHIVNTVHKALPPILDRLGIGSAAARKPESGVRGS